ncbi:MAG: RluA family pseudouridine synthase [Bacillota bacterium]
MRYIFCVNESEKQKRLDLYLTDKLERFSRSHIQKWIDDGLVKVNQMESKANYKIRENDLVSVRVPELKPLDLVPEKIDIEIVYEDEDIVVVNKPQGMVVHPAPGNYTGTLVNALVYHCKNLSGINGVLRPGIVHRIDKDTSGVLVVAKNDKAHVSLAQQIKEHSVTRIYKALVHGNITEPGGIIKTSIGRHPVDRKKMSVGVKNAKPAETMYTVLERFDNYTYIEARLKTGRTHQIRVHMAYIQHPVVGDPKYSKGKNVLGFTGQALHAATLGFKHPSTDEYMEFSAHLPAYFEKALDILRSN